MAQNNVVVTGTIVTPGEDPVTSGIIRFTLDRVAVDAPTSEVVSQTEYDALISPTGQIDINLWPNSRGVSASHYTVERVFDTASGQQSRPLGKVSVPENDAPHELGDLLAAGTPDITAVYVGIITPAQYASAFEAVAQAEAARDATIAAAAGVPIPENSLANFGAVGDAVIASDGTLASGTDDSAAIQAAFDWVAAAPGRKIVADPGRKYVIRSTINHTGNFRGDFGDAVFFIDANVPGFNMAAALSGPFDLSANYVIGSTSLSVVGDPLPVAPKAGTVMKIDSDALEPNNRDEGSNSGKYRMAEFFEVGVGSTTTNIVLAAPLQFNRAISPVSTAGNEGEVEPYRTEFNARIVYADNDARFHWQGGVIQVREGEAANGWKSRPFAVGAYRKPVIEGLKIARSYTAGIYLGGTFGAKVINCETYRCENNTSRGQFGYGVSDTGWHTNITGLIAHDTRHPYTTGEPTATDGATNPSLLIAVGPVLGGTITMGRTSGGTSSQWDTHQAARQITFRDCHAGPGGTHVAGLRGLDLVCDGIRSQGTEEGYFVFTEYSSGDPDDDFFVNGKTPDDHTRATIRNTEINCTEIPIEISHSRAFLGGKSRYTSQDHCAIVNTGSQTIIYGHHDFITVPGPVSHNRTGCITLWQTHSASGLTGSFVIIEGTVLIDARESDKAGIWALNLSPNTSLIVRGELRITLPANAAGFKVGTGSVRTEQDGRINYQVISDDDNVIGSAAQFDGCRVTSSDGRVDWYGQEGWHTLLDDVSFGGSHSGNTSMTEIANPPCQRGSYILDQDGKGRMYFVFEGRKNGVAGGATLRLRGSGGTFIWDGALGASDKIYRIEVDVLFLATGSQEYIIRYQSADINVTNDRLERKAEVQNFVSNSDAVTLSVQLANSGDEVTCERVFVQATKGGRLTS